MRLRTDRLCIDALLAAMCAVLGGLIKIDLRFVKVTLESYPVLLAALMFGPLDGALVGALGTFIYQILAYPLSLTTPLWILPYVICGACVGFYAKKSRFSNSPREIRLSILTMEICLLALNTAVICIDAKLYGYYSASYVFGAVGVRLALAAAKAVLFGSFTPRVLARLKRITHSDPR